MQTMLARVVLALVSLGAGAARAQDTIVVVGASKLPLSDSAAAVETIAIPVRYRPASARPVPTMQPLQVQWNGRLIPVGAFALALRPAVDSGAAPRAPSILATVDRSRLGGAGEYTVLTEVRWHVTKSGSGAAPARDSTQLLTLVFVQPAAELRSASPRRVERVLFSLPWQPALRPEWILLGETGGRAAFAPTDTVRRAELARADREPAGARVRLELPRRVGPDRQDTARLALEGTPALGLSTATLSIPSRTLAADTATIQVEVMTRVATWLLALIIAGGIAAGYLVRTRLERRRLEALARAAVAKERLSLELLAADTGDGAFRTRYEEALAALLAAADDPRASADDLTRAVAAAAVAREKILGEWEQQRAAAHARIAAWRQALGAPEPHARVVASEVERLRGVLEAQERELGAGRVTAVREFFESENANLASPLREVLTQWTAVVHSAIERMGAWPETLLEQAAAEPSSAVAAIEGKIQDARTPEQVQPLLEQAATLAQHVRYHVLEQGVPDVLRLAEGVAAALPELASRVGPARARLQQAVEALRRARAAAQEQLTTPETKALELTGVARAVGDVREALAKALGVASEPQQANTPEVRQMLAAGKFRSALDEVDRLLPRVEPPANDSSATVGTERHAASGRTLAATVGASSGALSALPPLPGAFALRITAPARVVVNEVAQLGAEVGARPDGRPRRVRLTWWVDGRAVERPQGTALAISFAPWRPGPVLVEVEAADEDTGERARARRSLFVLRTAREERDYQAGRAARDERMQTVALGVLIVLAGVLIFRSVPLDWLDTIAVPFLWGFSTDVGTARLRDLMLPVTQRTVPLPNAGG